MAVVNNPLGRLADEVVASRNAPRAAGGGTGPQGPVGPQGPTGPQGPAGAAGAPGTTDHGAQFGLGDDDHTQYHNDARGDARYSLLAHTHAGVYEPADATILKDADIGVSVAAQGHTHAQLHDAVSVTDSSTVDFTLTAQDITAVVRKQMSIVSDGSGIKLDGDATAPGNSKLYGTDGSGVKGWYDQPGGGGGLSQAQVLARGLGA